MEGITGLGEEVPTDKSREDNLTEEVTFYPREKEPDKKSDIRLSMEKESSCKNSTGPTRKLLCWEQNEWTGSS